MKVKKTFNKIRQFGLDSGAFEDGGDLKSICKEIRSEVINLSKAVVKKDQQALSSAIGICVMKLTHLAQMANERFINDCATCGGLTEYVGIKKGESEPKWVECTDCGNMIIEACITSALKKAKTSLSNT